MNTSKKYIQIYEYLRKKIENGEFGENGRLDSETVLCELFSTSRLTVRQATQILEQEGLVERRKGSGTYVKLSPAATYNKSRKSTHRIGLIISSINEPPYSTLCESIEQALSDNGYTLILRTTNNKFQTERDILKEFSELDLDGLIVSATRSALPSVNADMYEALRLSGVATVFFNETYKSLEFSAVTADDTAATCDLVNHLISLGHKKISCLFAIDSVQGHNRFSGYSKALLQNRLDLNDSFIHWYTSGDETHAASTFDTGDSTACICQTKPLAEALIEALDQNGIKVPQDFSVIGLDGPDQKDSTITTCIYPTQEVCATIIRILFQVMRGTLPASCTVPMSIHIGETTAPPKIHNPVIEGNWADPCILQDETGFYMYPTHRWNDSNFYTFHSDNLLHWSPPQKIMDLHSLSWAQNSAWSPSVIKYNNMYYMAYVANRHLGFAYCDSPDGEFINLSSAPFPTFVNDGQNVMHSTPYDPHLIVNEGKPYLMFGLKNCWLVGLNIDKDKITVDGTPVCLSERIFDRNGEVILQNDKNTFNGCARILKFKNRYLLTWSCYDTRDPRCQIRYAWGDNLDGPYIMPENNVLLKGNNDIVGTGHGCVVEHNGELRLFYHRIVQNHELYRQEVCREVCFDTIHIVDGDTLVVNPT